MFCQGRALSAAARHGRAHQGRLGADVTASQSALSPGGSTPAVKQSGKAADAALHLEIPDEDFDDDEIADSLPERDADCAVEEGGWCHGKPDGSCCMRPRTPPEDATMRLGLDGMAVVR